jgi:multicomponent Na+:H+ antiporter subunit F
MSDFAASIVPVTALLSLNLFALATLLAMLRMLMGPSLADRVVALDLVAALAVGAIASFAILTDQP